MAEFAWQLSIYFTYFFYICYNKLHIFSFESAGVCSFTEDGCVCAFTIICHHKCIQLIHLLNSRFIFYAPKIGYKSTTDHNSPFQVAIREKTSESCETSHHTYVFSIDDR